MQLCHEAKTLSAKSVLKSLISSLLYEYARLNVAEGALDQKGVETRVPISIAYIQDNKYFKIMTKHGEMQVTKRQLECLQCLIDGYTTKEAAGKLYLSIRTVEKYLEILRHKLGCKNRIEMVRVLFDIV